MLMGNVQPGGLFSPDLLGTERRLLLIIDITNHLKRANKMKRMIIFITLLTSLYLACAHIQHYPSLKGKYPESIVSLILNNLPAPNAKNFKHINSTLIELGKPAIREICSMIAPTGEGDDSKARFALDGLAIHVTRPDAEEERKLYVKAISDALEAETRTEVKTFLIKQLQFAGKDESVDVLSKYLNDPQLCDPAVRALSAIGTENAKSALLKALEHADGDNRITLVIALGELYYEPAASEIIKHTDSKNNRLRMAALFAIANIGVPDAENIFEKSMSSEHQFQNSEVKLYYLLYAKRCAEKGDAAKCSKICRHLLENSDLGDELHIQSTALHTLIKVNGSTALSELLQIMDNQNKQLKQVALGHAGLIPGKDATEKWIDKMEQVDQKTKCMIMEMLGNRGDKTALPAVMEELHNNDSRIRISAIYAAAKLGGIEILTPLLEVMKTSTENHEIESIKEVLLTLPINERIQDLVEILPLATPPARKALLEIFSERHFNAYNEVIIGQAKAENEGVRLAAIKALETLGNSKELPDMLQLFLQAEQEKEKSALQKAMVKTAVRLNKKEMLADLVLGEINKSNGGNKKNLIKILGKLGGAKALQTVKAEIKNKDEEIRDAAIRALINWPNEEAIEEILNVAQNSKDIRYNALALRGCARLVNSSELQSLEKLRIYCDALQLVRRPDEKKLILAGLAGLGTIESLELVAKYLPDETVSYEAAQAALKIASSRTDEKENLTTSEVAMAFIKTQVQPQTFAQILNQFKSQSIQLNNEISSNSKADTADVCAEHQKTVQVDLFNGKNLTGWQQIGGNESAWKAKDGILFTEGEGGGWLSTTQEYGDFKLELEFRVPKGGNSGIFLRAPHHGDPAYTGMEVQILDDYAHKYANLKPWQYTGSVYGVQAPSERITKRAGEWQKMVVTCNGPRVSVILNGKKIVDTNLIQYMDKTKRHPGLKRRKGCIGLQNHSTKIEYKNIFITELQKCN